VDDVPAPNALEVVFVRSTHAHAQLKRLDLDAARAVPGVIAAYSAGDLGAFNRPLPLLFPHPDLVQPRTQTPMAAGHVNYAGQIVAMVVAEDRYAAEDGRDAITVESERLPVVIDLDAAVSEDSPLVHADIEGNIAGRIVQVVGDPDRGFDEADVVLQRRYVMERSAAMPIETRGLMVEHDSRTGDLTIWDATQVVHPLRSALAEWFGLPEERIRVIAPDTGGAFGVKGFFPYPEEVLVPWVAMRLGRPVKWTEDRLEHFTASHHERKQIHEVEIAATQTGELVALRDRFMYDAGAYVPYGLELGRITASQIGGLYRVPNIRIELIGVYTNTITCTPYRGAGRPFTCFVMERALDDLADAIGIDRLEIRRRNFIASGEFPYRRDGLVTADGFTVVMDSGSYHEQLEILESSIDIAAFRERQEQSRDGSRWLGLGIACYVESTGGGPYEGARVSVAADTGKILVVTGFTTQGQSHATTLAQVAAAQLGVGAADVEVTTGDTAAFGWGVATYASRGAVLGGNAVARAAQAVGEKARRLAANMLEVDAQDIELVDGHARVKGAPDSGLELRQIAKAARPDRYGFDPDVATLRRFRPAVARPLADEGPILPSDEEPGLESTGYFSSRNATWASGAHAAIIEIDIETGQVQFERYIAVHDCGTMINPTIVDGQIIGGVAQGIGGSLYERIAYDAQGQVQNGSWMDFLMPYATEIPALELHHLETPSPLNPLGIKGAGEAGTIPVAAVVAAAVEDALAPRGVKVPAMPLEPQTILELLSTTAVTEGRPENGGGG
jgi:CO/xanthine dehydrogenase Mo-binding subunit